MVPKCAISSPTDYRYITSHTVSAIGAVSLVFSGVVFACMQAGHCCTVDVNGQRQTAVCFALFGSILLRVIPVQKRPWTVSGYTDTAAVLY